MYKFTLSAFGDEISKDLTRQMDVLENFGIKFIELRGIDGVNISDWKLEDFRSVVAKMKARGFGASSLGSPIGKIGINENFAPHLEKFKNTLELAAEIETKFIRMFSFYIPEQDRNSEGYLKYRENVIEKWQMFVEAAKGYDATLLHENEHGIYGESAENCLDLLKTLNSPQVRAVFDPANFILDGHDVLSAFDLLADYTVYFHVKDASQKLHKVVPAGEGDGNYPLLIEMLKKRDFHGFLSIEPHLATGDIAVGGDTLFETAYNALKKLI